MSEHKTGCYRQHSYRERGLIQKIQINIINKDIEKKKAPKRALGYISDKVSPLIVVRFKVSVAVQSPVSAMLTKGQVVRKVIKGLCQVQ